jgi:hypothetical protein
MGAKLVIPMHYEGEKHPQGTERFEKFAQEMGLNYRVLGNGESLDL